MTEIINLSGLNMNHFTEFDAELYCKILNIDPDNIKVLFLYNNNLTDTSGVSIFKNLEKLFLSNNNITDLSSLINLVNLKCLDISNLSLTDESDTVDMLKTLPNLKDLYCHNTFKTVNMKKEPRNFKVYD